MCIDIELSNSSKTYFPPLFTGPVTINAQMFNGFFIKYRNSPSYWYNNVRVGLFQSELILKMCNVERGKGGEAQQCISG